MVLCGLNSSCARLIFFGSRYEFGGPWGVVAIMTGFPILMYYLWICLVFYDGQLVFPKSADDIGPFFGRMWDHVRVARLVPLSIFLYLALTK